MAKVQYIEPNLNKGQLWKTPFTREKRLDSKRNYLRDARNDPETTKY